MKLHGFFTVALLGVAPLFSFACSDDDSGGSADSGTDGSSDAANPDAAKDGSADSANDANVDPEAGQDGSVDGSQDAATDSGLACNASIGASAGAQTLGATVYDAGETTLVSDVIFDASTGGDLVVVTGAGTNVIFERVTFRGSAIGDQGHTLRVSGQGSVEIRNSIFEGTPATDHIRFAGHDPSNIDCTVFKTKPGAAHINIEQGGEVLVRNSDFSGGGALENRNAFGYVEVSDSIGIDAVLFDEGTTGIVSGNAIANLKLFLAVNTLVEDNTIASVEHGDSASDNDAIDTYFLNNVIEAAEDNDGTCYSVGNTGADPVPFCMQEAAPWY